MVSLLTPDLAEIADLPGGRPTVQVKYVDTSDGGLWVTWRWEHALDRPRLAGIQPPLPALAALRAAAPRPADGETVPDALRRSWAVLGDVDQEMRLAEALAGALFPAPLVAELEHFRARRPHLRVQGSPALAVVPWEALRVDDGERLVHRCDVSLLLPASVRGSRTRTPAPHRPGGPVVAAVSPVVPGAVASLEPVMRTSEPLVEAMLAGLGDRLRGTPAEGPVRSHLDRERLRELLADAARFLYVGHVSAGTYALGTSLHLTDGPEARGRAPLVSGVHRPLLAADVALDGWAAPSRVALVGCASGGDTAYADPAGLVAAFTARGAQYVTAARWALPTDAGLDALTGSGTRSEAFARAVVAVDAAHEAADPVAALGAWQREQAEAWERTGDPAHSPVVWAALGTAWS
ncbi:CHAT domain-containing protein [Promicromonospora thailandica]|uniref:CHAT domain-containing protein n=1 Tax=Promicromonospora thailandica TaxID=765201 RepID=A0A9X2G7Y7_9MICO|nr:CHAT domain-containing protein [Promicromonospora thailandica]MCP2267238.1 CHAT domain-containing protein [Promicromonospora thailandica]